MNCAQQWHSYAPIRRTLLLAAAVIFCSSGVAQAQSTKPDTPTALKGNTVIAHFKKDAGQATRYFTNVHVYTHEVEAADHSGERFDY